MAERKATNKYYPPEWDPTKGSINKFNNSHHLRSRAKKLDKGILVVRFGMPFNVWCLKCENHVGAGVRYNAEKSKIGNYYDTPIYLFRMKCRLCDNYFEIKTDPKKFDYEIVNGARKQVKYSDTDVIELEHPFIGSNKGSEGSKVGAMQKLERNAESRVQAGNDKPSLLELMKWRERWKDNYTANQLLRKQYRDRRKKLAAIERESKKILRMTSLKIPSSRSTQDETALAEAMVKQAHTDICNAREMSKKRAILQSDILSHRRNKCHSRASRH